MYERGLQFPVYIGKRSQKGSTGQMITVDGERHYRLLVSSMATRGDPPLDPVFYTPGHWRKIMERVPTHHSTPVLLVYVQGWDTLYHSLTDLESAYSRR